jgi:hypothetical protein
MDLFTFGFSEQPAKCLHQRSLDESYDLFYEEERGQSHCSQDL